MGITLADAIIEHLVSRSAIGRCDSSGTLGGCQIRELARIAATEQTSCDCQTWCFIAVRAPEAKVRPRAIVHGDSKGIDAKVIIIYGELADYSTPLAGAESGMMSARRVTRGDYVGCRSNFEHPQRECDQVVCAGASGVTALIHAARVLGLCSTSTIRLDAEEVARGLERAEDKVLVILLIVRHRMSRTGSRSRASRWQMCWNQHT